MTQVGEMFSRFQEKDKEFGDTPEKYLRLVEQLEERYGQSTV
jgi:hypothetical protein